jgi:hypothetical protein
VRLTGRCGGSLFAPFGAFGRRAGQLKQQLQQKWQLDPLAHRSITQCAKALPWSGRFLRSSDRLGNSFQSPFLEERESTTPHAELPPRTLTPFTLCPEREAVHEESLRWQHN